MKKIVLLLFVSVFTFISCDDVDENYETGASVVGFRETSKAINHFTDIGVVHYDVPFDLITGYSGTASGSDIDVTYEIDPSSTAVEGTEFDFTSTNGVSTIPAGSKFGLIGLEINTGSFDPNVATTLVLNITSTDAVVAAGTDQVVIKFVGCISPIATGAYSWTSTAGFSGTANLVQIDVNEYSFPFPGVTSGGNPIPMYFNDICGELTYLGWDFEDGYMTSVTSLTYGPGDDPNVLIFNDLKVFNGTSPDTGVFFDRGVTTYTKM